RSSFGLSTLRMSCAVALRANCHRSYFLAEHTDFLSVQPEHDPHEELEHARYGQTDVVKRVLPEHVQSERKGADLIEPGKLQQLSQAIFGHDVEVVDVMS